MTDEADIHALIWAIRNVSGMGQGYTPLDRHRDFRRVFLGSEEGRRVLGQIVDLCEGSPIGRPDLSDHSFLAARAWARKLGMQISAWATIPPRETVQQTSPE